MPSDKGHQSASQLALALLAPLSLSCATTGGFGVEFCVDDTGRPVSCDCSPDGWTLAYRTTTVREYSADGEPTERVYEARRPMSLVLRGYWFHASFGERSPGAGAASAATWLRCGNNLIAGQATFFRTRDYDLGGHSQQFLVFFPRPPEEERFRSPVCEMHIVTNGSSGRRVEHHVQRVQVASAIATTRPPNKRSMSWRPVTEMEPNLERVDPPPPDPPALLCRTTAEK